MTLDEAIKHAEEVVEEQEELYKLCPASESFIFHCDGTKDCKSLKNGKNKGCQRCAEEHRQLAEWLKELNRLREKTRWIPISEGLPKEDGWYMVTVIVDFNERSSAVAIYKFVNNDLSKEYWSKFIEAWMPLPEPYKEEE